MVDIDERYFEICGDGEWFDEIQKLDNELLNIWIRIYYKRYWVEHYHTLSETWKKEMINDCEQYSVYFDWVNVSKYRVPHIKDGIKLSNKECLVLEFIIENYSGLHELDIGQIHRECLDNEKETENYKRALLQTTKFP